ncbi:hypothetical protein FKM82_029316 [Ascaphus truei]
MFPVPGFVLWESAAGSLVGGWERGASFSGLGSHWPVSFPRPRAAGPHVNTNQVPTQTPFPWRANLFHGFNSNGLLFC